MSTHILSLEEVRKLSKHPSVLKCSEKSVTYTDEFKRQVLNLYAEGVSPKMIWRRAGLDIYRNDYPRECVKRWKRIVQRKGVKGLATSSGTQATGRPKTKDLTPTDTIKRLQLEVAYLKAENDFLAKLRAKRAETNSGQRRNTKSSEK